VELPVEVLGDSLSSFARLRNGSSGKRTAGTLPLGSPRKLDGDQGSLWAESIMVQVWEGHPSQNGSAPERSGQGGPSAGAARSDARLGVIPTTGLTALEGIDDALHPATARRFSRGCIDVALALAGATRLSVASTRPVLAARLLTRTGASLKPRPRENLKVISYDAISRCPPVREARAGNRGGQARSPDRRIYPLAEAARAQERLAAGQVLRKIVLRIPEEVDQWR